MDEDKFVLAIVAFGFFGLLAYFVFSRSQSQPVASASAPMLRVKKDEQGNIVSIESAA